eukprot:2043780-Rhodomonas_salina.2
MPRIRGSVRVTMTTDRTANGDMRTGTRLTSSCGALLRQSARACGRPDPRAVDVSGLTATA